MSGPYTIQLGGLSEGRHIIDFEIGNEFFELFEESEIKEGSLIAEIELEKSASISDLVIRISGNISICCDRCLEMFLQPVLSENRLLVRYGKSMEDTDPEPRGEKRTLF